MRPVKMYFAGDSFKNDEFAEEAQIENKLTSFLYPQQFSTWIETTSEKPGYIIIDSGAFSAWNIGKTVDLGEYIDYALECIAIGKKNNKIVRIVNLDVIPEKIEEFENFNANISKESKQIIDFAASAGFENMMRMKNKGIIPIHVYHQGEDIHWLDEMLKQTDYIGLSPRFGLTSSRKTIWINSIFSYLYHKKSKVDVHGFAVFNPVFVKNFPWTSVDATSWVKIGSLGRIVYPIGGYKNPNFEANPLNLKVSTEIRQDGSFPKEQLQMFIDDGIDIEKLQTNSKYRKCICAKYFTSFNRWVNKEKENFEFIPSAEGFFK